MGKKKAIAEEAAKNIISDDDPILPLINSKILANKIPNATLSVIKNGDHLFLFAQTEKIIPEIEIFLTKF